MKSCFGDSSSLITKQIEATYMYSEKSAVTNAQALVQSLAVAAVGPIV